MKRLELVAVFLLTAAFMTGCTGSGSGSSGLGSSGGSSGSSSLLGSGSSSSGSVATSTTLPHNPEPATMALVATGLAAFALFRRKKK